MFTVLCWLAVSNNYQPAEPICSFFTFVFFLSTSKSSVQIENRQPIEWPTVRRLFNFQP